MALSFWSSKFLLAITLFDEFIWIVTKKKCIYWYFSKKIPYVAANDRRTTQTCVFQCDFQKFKFTVRLQLINVCMCVFFCLFFVVNGDQGNCRGHQHAPTVNFKRCFWSSPNQPIDPNRLLKTIRSFYTRHKQMPVSHSINELRSSNSLVIS